MKNFDWKAGFRRAAIFILLYAAILYVMATVFPETFGIAEGQLTSILIQGVFFFFILAVFFSWTEKRRRQRVEELKARKRNQQSKPDGEDAEPGLLKGQPNPNTSRKKARRRR